MPEMSHAERIRAYELQQVVAELAAGCRILEIGAGAGWQARALAEMGFEIEAVDVAAGLYADSRVWPVKEYDGRHLPFADGAFDLVFSSNVLEHVGDVEGLQQEIHRVLRRHGRAIHVLPTPAWRLWTNVSHYLFFAKLALLLLRPRLQHADSMAGRDLHRRAERGDESWARTLRRGLRVALPLPHGERGNCVSELYWFSRGRWLQLFRRNGWVVEASRPMRLFYSGHEILGTSLSMRARRSASFLLGSSTMVYILRQHAAE